MAAIKALRARLYDAAIVHMTAGWYRAVIDKLPPHCRLLDVGIGTGSALLASAGLLVEKDLRVTGVDVDAAYVERCRQEIVRRRLEDRIAVRLESIYDHHGGPYDAAYFSGSFMLLPDPPAALLHVGALLVPGGRMYFTQTFERRRSPMLEVIKPLLRLVTTIDFGRVTYEPDFRSALAAGGLELEELHTLSAARRRASVLAVARRSGSRSTADPVDALP